MLSSNLPCTRTCTPSCPTLLLFKPWQLALLLSQSGPRNYLQPCCGYESWLLLHSHSLKRPHVNGYGETAIPRCSAGWAQTGSVAWKCCLISTGSMKKSTPYDQSEIGVGWKQQVRGSSFPSRRHCSVCPMVHMASLGASGTTEQLSGP